MKKKYIIYVIISLFCVELFRGLYYRFSLKKAYLEVITYIEENRNVDQELVSLLKNDNIILEYKNSNDEILIKLSRKHIILFVIDTNVTLNQKYIISRLNK